MILTIFFIIVVGGSVSIGMLIDYHNTKKNTSYKQIQPLQTQPVAPPTFADKREDYFNSAVDMIARTMFQNRFVGWKYAWNIGGNLRSANEINEIIVFLKDGSATGVTLKREQVYAKMGIPIINQSSASSSYEKKEKTPEEVWIENHAADLETKIAKAKDKGFVSIDYLVDEGYLSVIDEIVDLLNERTIYTVTKSDDKLFINFESLFSYDD